ncbi:hypothetical protein [Pseudomonas indica]|uniref:hypothetical protein n=1 Tax=Pseudomonas indica TaxID=137658 RepID=UPI003FD2BA59
MSNVITECRLALKARLETIQVSNGYLTNVGANVHTGWLKEVLAADKVGYPLVCIQRGKGLPPEKGQNAWKTFPGYLVIGAVSAGLDEYEDDIEALELDLMRCLMPAFAQHLDWLPPGVPTLRMGEPETLPPGDGVPAATILIPIYPVTFIEQ